MIINRQEAERMLNNAGNLLRDTGVPLDEGSFIDEVISEMVDDIVSPDKPILYTPPGTKRNIPPIFREIIAIQSNITGNGAAVAREYGISARHANELKGGNVSRPEQREHRGKTESDIELAAALEKSLSKVRNKALDKIYASMDAINDEELPDEQPKTLALIAANLSRVVSSTLRDKKDGPVVNVQTVFYSPEKANKEQYDVIDV